MQTPQPEPRCLNIPIRGAAYCYISKNWLNYKKKSQGDTVSSNARAIPAKQTKNV